MWPFRQYDSGVNVNGIIDDDTHVSEGAVAARKLL
jgi:hypothetical protein